MALNTKATSNADVALEMKALGFGGEVSGEMKSPVSLIEVGFNRLEQCNKLGGLGARSSNRCASHGNLVPSHTSWTDTWNLH